eukprot:scaffold20106_cov111-Isochrysis_galbana.AAC.9
MKLTIAWGAPSARVAKRMRMAWCRLGACGRRGLCALPASSSSSQQQIADWLVCERTSCSTVFWPRRLRFFEWINPSTDQEVLDGFVPPVVDTLLASRHGERRWGEAGDSYSCASANEWTCQSADCRGSTQAARVLDGAELLDVGCDGRFRAVIVHRSSRRQSAKPGRSR